MTETPKPQLCGKCGTALSGYAPDGLCAACLLESAFEERDGDSAGPSRSTPLLAFHDYELVEEIARGGMGVVYRARQISLNRPVALKMILGGHLANAAEVKRFRAEAETAAQLQHPNIVAIHEVGEHAGQPFFSMDLVEGRNLAQLVRDEPLPSRKAASYLKTIAAAVQYAHSRGVLHRDLKPSNILIDESDQPRITDFGLAKRLNDSQLSANDPQLTQTGQVLGSPSFIPPEQAAGQKNIGPASDVYSLGAILYHCLTARPPFMAETLTQTLRMVAEQEPVAPRLLNASVPRDLETICLKCLEKNPQSRYATAQAVADELNRFMRHEPIRARPMGLVLKVHRWCLRNKPLAGAGTAILALLLVVAIGSPIAAYRIDRERQQAQANEKTAEAIKTFLVSMLEGVGPSKALGRDTAMLREILDKTADRVGKELEDQPRAEADLRMILGKTYADLGHYTNALQITREALRLRQLHFGSNSVPVADAMANIAAFLYSAGDAKSAEAVNRQALELRRSLLGNNHTNVATSLNNLSLNVASQGRLAEAEEIQMEALEMRRGLLGEAHLDVGKSLLNLGIIQFARGNYTGAEPVTVKALAIFSSQLDEGSPAIAYAQNNLAVMHARKGELEQAASLHRKMLEVRKRVLNGEHDDIAFSLIQLAVVLTDLGESDEAETKLREALDMLSKLGLVEHGNTADALAALGTVLAKKGDLSAAETNLQSALDLRIKLLGAENLDVADSLDALAIVKAVRGDLPGAKELLAQAVAMNEKGVGKDHVNLIPMHYHLGWVLQQQGDATAASAERNQALAESLKHGVYGVWPLLKGIFELADILQAQSRFTEAEPLLADAAKYTQHNLRENLTLHKVTCQRLTNLYEFWNRSVPSADKASQAADWRKKLEELEPPAKSTQR